MICFAGDGCFPDARPGIRDRRAISTCRLIALVINNGMYGTIRMHQEREYPGRVSATALNNPDFAAFARAYGGHGETVKATEEFGPAVERARASGKPAIIEIVLDPEAITPSRTLTEISQAKSR